MRKKISIFILLLLLGVFTYSQQLFSSISRSVIKYGEPVVLRIEVKGTKFDKVNFPIIKDTLSYHLEILKNKKDVIIKNEIYRHIDSISFSSYELGTFTIPPQKIIINNKEYYTPIYKIKVDSIAIDTLKQPLYDIKPIIKEPKKIWDYFEQYWPYFLLVSLSILLLTLIVFLYYRKKRNNKNMIIPINHYEVAINKLEKLEKSNLLEKGLIKKFYSEMIFTLKEYIEAQWNVPATKLLSDDLIDWLKRKKHIDLPNENKLYIILQIGDMAKFAKHKPNIVEAKLHLDIAKDFINSIHELEKLENEHDKY